MISAGLAWIGGNHHVWSTTGVMPFARLELRLEPGKYDPGLYSEELMQQMLTLAKSVGKIRSSGGRLYDLASFQIAALILGVRVAAQRIRHGHTETTIGDFDRRAKRLIARLEKYRKRAKRAYIRQHGADNYRAQEQGWQRFVRWLRVHFLDCPCQRRRRTRGPRFRRAVINQLADWGKAELIDRHDTVPPDRELRKFVRLALRYVRRGRTGYSIRDLIKDQVFGGSRIANFITLRLEKRKQAE
jgi:hypothetical protein